MSSRSFNHRAIEKKWQEKWQEDALYAVSVAEARNPFYVLVEFPYPSGNLHVGHWYAFAVTDIFARFKRMEGFDVLFPIGFDAFGLPAENAALKHGKDPWEWTKSNMEHMEMQLESMGASFDWSRKIVTADPKYYRFTQYFITKLFERGLLYQKELPVNWCPSCNTVLANEQVISGHCERCDTEVVRKQMKQWMLRITHYADRLLEDLDSLDWPSEIKEAQRNWIGKSVGAEIDFVIVGRSEKISVFTTRADTIFSGTFLILAPEHPLIDTLKDQISNMDEVREYQAQAEKKSAIERTDTNNKSGVALRGVMAINPATGAEIPVWVSDFVLNEYGTGAVFADAHDERDFQMAKQYGIPLAVSIVPNDPKQADGVRALETCFSGEGVLINSEHFDGLHSSEARPKIIAWLEEKGSARATVQYKLRDWSISRQRYWGCPIPIVYDPEGKAHAIPEEHLPWELPSDVSMKPTGKAPLAESEALLARTEAIFGKGWTPEVETLDTFVDSSWYFFRYLDPQNTERFASKEIAEKWMPVDFYSGGAEHTTLHLLYSRFFTKALFDTGLSPVAEPYTARLNRALILGPDGNKMSKSKGNVIDPDAIVETLGADTMRLYLAFIGPYNETGHYPWDPNGVVGMRRFLERVFELRKRVAEVPMNDALTTVMHQTIKKVRTDMARLKFNTAIASLMTLLNILEKNEECAREAYVILLQLLAPIAPHSTEELWESLGESHSIHHSTFPSFDPAIVAVAPVTIAVQVNGKVRGSMEVFENDDREAVLLRARALPNVAKALADATVEKEIVVPKKIVNFVLEKGA